MANKELMKILDASAEKLAGLTDDLWNKLSEEFVYDELDFSEWHNAVYRGKFTVKMMLGADNVFLHCTRMFPTWKSMSGKMWFSVRVMKRNRNGQIKIMVIPVLNERVSNPDIWLTRNTNIVKTISKAINYGKQNN